MFEAIVHIVDPDQFTHDVYAKRNDAFRQATDVETLELDGPRTVSAPGGLVSIRSSDRLNVEDVLLDVEQDEVDGFIKQVA